MVFVHIIVADAFILTFIIQIKTKNLGGNKRCRRGREVQVVLTLSLPSSMIEEFMEHVEFENYGCLIEGNLIYFWIELCSGFILLAMLLSIQIFSVSNMATIYAAMSIRISHAIFLLL